MAYLCDVKNKFHDNANYIFQELESYISGLLKTIYNQQEKINQLQSQLDNAQNQISEYQKQNLGQQQNQFQICTQNKYLDQQQNQYPDQQQDISQYQNDQLVQQNLNQPEKCVKPQKLPYIRAPMPIICIDLGTSRCTVGYYCINAGGKGRMEIIAHSDGKKSMPSTVCITDKEIFIGDDANSMSNTYPKNYIYDTKRMLGHKFKDPEIQQKRKFWTFETVESQNGDILIEVNGRKYEPYKISGMILKELVNMANSHLENTTNRVIITIPANFNSKQKKDTLKAAKYAKIEIVEFIQEPVSATLSYGYQVMNCKTNINKNILVYDLGGGTLDVSLVNVNNNHYNVIATGGDNFLGGADFTNCLFDYLSPSIDKLAHSTWKNDKQFVCYLKRRCDEIKSKLSTKQSEKLMIQIPPKLQKTKEKLFETIITRKKFEEMIEYLVEKCMIPVCDLMRNTKKNIDDIILIGGSTYIPKIQSELIKLTKINVSRGICPVEAVASGACTLAGNILLKELKENYKTIYL